MHYLWMFLAGALLCNGIPHLAAGLRGEAFPTPFAKPPGRGDSSPLVNVLWGSINVFAGVALAAGQWSSLHATSAAVAGLGWLATGIFLALHFGAVRARRG